jgi:hypothetical protein
MSTPDDDIDLIYPPASRPTWATLVYAVVFALLATLLVQWPAISRLLGL